MSNLRKVVKNYFNCQKEIFSAFNTSGWEEINSHIGESWFKNEYDEFNFLDEEGEVYSFESAKQVGDVVDGLILFYVQENGEKYYSIFEKDKEMGQEEAEKIFY